MDSIGRALENIYVMTIGLILVIAWMMGIAFTVSWWAVIPFYSWYVVIEKAMHFYHIFGYAS